MGRKGRFYRAAAAVFGTAWGAVCLLPWVRPEAEAAGSIISSFQLPGPYARLVTGLTKVGDNYWFTEGWGRSGYEPEYIYEVTAGGNVVSSFPAPGGRRYLKGLAARVVAPWGNCLWLCAGEPKEILTVTTAGSVVSSFGINHYGGDLAWDGDILYCTDYVGRKIYKYTAGGSVVGTLAAPDADPNSGRVPYGVAWDGQYLWVVCYGKGDQIYKLNAATGSIYGSFPVPNEYAHVLAITEDGAYLTYADDAVDMAFTIDK